MALVSPVVALLGGCWGSIGDPGNSNSVCGPIPEAPLRRLSHTEYRNTVRDLFPQLALPDLQLAPDPTPHGFDNDADSLVAAPLLVNQYSAAAAAIAEEVRQNRAQVLTCDPADGSACGRTYILDVAARAFRRPPGQDEIDRLQAIFDAYLVEGFDVALELTTQAILQSPQFLYRTETGGVEPGTSGAYDVASRLSYFLWTTMPDQPLFDAASRGELASTDGIAAQVDRMLADPRALDGFMTFTRQWVELARLDYVTKPSADGWSEDVRTALREEARRFLDEIVFRRGGTIRDFLTSNRVFIGPETAAFYGLPAPADWTEVDLPADRRGYLMQAQFLSAHGHPNNPSPVLRGLFVLRNLLCVDLGSPPAGVDMTIPAGDGTPSTNRENYERVTGAELCRTCHAVINPVGFAFEAYDTFGRLRTEDNGLPIDTTAVIADTTFAGPHEMIEYLAASQQVQQCVAGKYLTYATGGTTGAADACLARDVEEELAATGGSLTHLMRAIATHPRFLGTAEEKR
jgi:hypothetical protein